jgi:type IV pilus assembly protein PilC
MLYRYTAYTGDKRVIEGTIDAASEQLAKDRLWQSGHRVLSLKAARVRRSFRQQFPTIFGVKGRDVIVFSRQLATLVERGVNAFAALEILRDQIRNPAFRDVVASLVQDLEQGTSFADAVSKHPNAFPPMYSRMVGVGEKTGNLHQVLRQVAGYMEKEKAALKRVSGALVYPALVLVVACGVVAILMTFTLPPLLDMFTEFDAELPLVTKVLVGTVGLVTGYWQFYLPVMAVAVILVVLRVRTPAGRGELDRLLLAVPLIGSIIAQREMAHLCRTMSLSLQAGLSMVEAMDLSIQTAQNTVVRQALANVRTRVVEGRGLHQALDADGLFPSLLVQMVRVGEQVGTLGLDLETVGDLYEQEVDERVNFLLAMMQPALILILGVVVAFIAISVIMPMYSVMGAI